MRLRWPRAVSLVNGRVLTEAGVASSMRFSGRVLAFDTAPRSTDAVIDLEGSWVIPGLINAHDHLELNHYGRLGEAAGYANASEWIDDLRPRIREDAAILERRRHPLSERLFIGGLKNLLAGVTTVAHHNPLYRDLRVPVRVLRSFGWAHSLGMETAPVGARGEPGGVVRERYGRTSRRMPFIVHAGEGTDAAAAAEIPELDRQGCLHDNTVVVHGVALQPSSWLRMLERRASLVWCPQSNLSLFGRTLDVEQLIAAHPDAPARICLGTDSRLTGARDLLDELRVAFARGQTPERPFRGLTPECLFNMVTTTAATILRLREAGRLTVGGPADFAVIPGSADSAAASLLRTTRRDVACVAVGGRPMVAAPAFADAFAARGVATGRLRVDGVSRLAHAGMHRTIGASAIAEDGVTCH